MTDSCDVLIVGGGPGRFQPGHCARRCRPACGAGRGRAAARRPAAELRRAQSRPGAGYGQCARCARRVATRRCARDADPAHSRQPPGRIRRRALRCCEARRRRFRRRAAGARARQRTAGAARCMPRPDPPGACAAVRDRRHGLRDRRNAVDAGGHAHPARATARRRRRHGVVRAHCARYRNRKCGLCADRVRDDGGAAARPRWLRLRALHRDGSGRAAAIGRSSRRRRVDGAGGRCRARRAARRRRIHRIAACAFRLSSRPLFPAGQARFVSAQARAGNAPDRAAHCTGGQRRADAASDRCARLQSRPA